MLDGTGGGHWDFSILQVWPMFGLVFSAFALKNCGFSVLVSCAICGFFLTNIVFGFRFLSTMMAVFGFFSPMHFTVLLVLPRKLHPTVALKL